jgi:hypothetical protein
MSYTINNTDGTLFATIPDGTINQSSSMTLVGKNYAGYGAFLDTNFLHLLQNSSNNVPPSAPIIGQLWWDNSKNILSVYAGASGFKTIGSASYTSTAPTNPSPGDLWFDSTNQQLNVYSSGFGAQPAGWVLIGPTTDPAVGNTAAVAKIYKDAVNIGAEHIVLDLFVQNQPVGIISIDPPFSPAPAIPGYGNIQPGINLINTNTTGGNIAANAMFYGNALNSFNLLVNGTAVPGNSFVQNGGGGGGNGIVLAGNVTVQTSLGVGSLTSPTGTDGDVRAGKFIAVGPVGFNGNGSELSQIPGANVVGAVGNAVYATNAGTATTADGLNVSNSYGLVNLTASGSITAVGDITAYFSDEKLKTNLGKIENALDKVRSLSGFYYEANELAQSLGFEKKREVGLSAQAVERVLPEITAPAPVDSQYLTLKYERMSALLVEAIKELADQVDDIKKRLG